VNQVSLIIGNAAGLIVRETGTSGLTPDESAALLQIANDLSDVQIDVAEITGTLATLQTDYGYIRTDLTLIGKVMRNKKVVYRSGANAGKMIIYDNDGTTVLLTAQVYEDQAATIAYRGAGLEHQDRLQ
jgi:hypothetical protein